MNKCVLCSSSEIFETKYALFPVLTETMFPKLTAVSHYSPTGIRVKWNKLRTLVLRQLTHYNVTYEEVGEAGYPVFNSSSKTVNVRADSRKLTLSGLKIYTTYKIRVDPVTFDGKMHNNKIMFAGMIS